MKQSLLKIGIALIAGCLMMMACEKQTTIDTHDSLPPSNDQDQTEQIDFMFIAVDEWLPETQWTVRRMYHGFVDESYTWTQFRSLYDANRFGDLVSPNCHDTIDFGDGTYTIYGDHTNDMNGDYSITDSVVSLGNIKLFQINADSMIVYAWHDCSYTQDIQQWLFTRIQ